ncbi:hypothetical protein PTKIN_Ptkin14bG0055800 [Pterospermum kingtungense]
MLWAPLVGNPQHIQVILMEQSKQKKPKVFLKVILMAKRHRVISEQVDRFCCLPEELRCRIMSLLPIKDAVRASSVSTSWNDVFSSISNLDFEDCFTRRKSESDSYMNFVDRVLFYRTGFVDRFRLKCGEFIKSNRLDGWIRYALRNNVRDLYLLLNCKEFKGLPNRVFTCKTLVSLKLDVNNKCKYALKLPVKVCLPSLKVLHLSGIKYPDDNSMQRLFSSCSVLEELVVTGCVLQRQCKINICSPTLKNLTLDNYTWRFPDDYDIKIEIDAPSLVYFKYGNLPQCFLLKNLNSLVRADINLGSLFNFGHTYNAVATDLFRGISNVQTLHLTGAFGEADMFGTSSDFVVGWERALPYLLERFPCLEALVLQVYHRFSGNSSRVQLPSNSFPSFLWSQLKTLKILSFEGQKNQMHMVKHFLDNAEVLENFTVETEAKDRRNPEKWRSRITKKLLNLPRVLEKSKVSINFL